MSVEQVAGAIRAALQRLPDGAVAQAEQDVDEARQSVTAAVAGSTQAEAHQSVTLFAGAQQALAGVAGVFAQVRALMEGYLARLSGTPAAGSPVAPASWPAALRPAGPDAAQTPPPPPHIQEILDRLPPPVPKPNPQGRKTHGRVVGDPADEVVISGSDSDSAEIWRLLQERGVTVKFKPMTINHVEMKVALRMIREGTRKITLVINNRSCPGELSCEALLPVLLPEGYCIEVYGPGYHDEFPGGRRWPS
ncbi:DddA-like double-stranded DNA deaminase toxin [Actinokineospora bangkokensis]|uniref:SCP1.201-like deaminase n=1 Tax=Actinokineospora bangkokensis TaxID=1193682 RepID=A0A1Q9LQ04_9PSEU|nr:DddA-like double-stranded DNA deaminase toxin [Actinokineospora bangkokensis]OLR94102.1 hypothetical protein BJP25_09775 [Actinokineospora bangkokensis]